MIRVVVADDHHLVRQGIRALLEKADDIEVVAEATDGQEAVELVERLVPDVLVIDVAMPRLSGNQAVGRGSSAQGKGVVRGPNAHDPLARSHEPLKRVPFVRRHGATPDTDQQNVRLVQHFQAGQARLALFVGENQMDLAIGPQPLGREAGERRPALGSTLQ